MPPRKKAETQPVQRDAFPHVGDCSEPRMESYPANRPDGSEVVVTRCQECGANTVK